MSDNLHISILEIFNDLKKKLSFSDETSIYPLTFDENKILFNNQLLNIDSSIKVDNFFSNSFLKYNSSFIPLFFYTTKSAIISNKKFIRKEANSLFINPLLKEILLSFNIQPDFLDTAYDAHEILFKLESALSFTDNTELVLVDGLCFFNYSISYAITLYPYLKRAIENPNTDLKLMPLFLTTPSSNKQEELLGQYKQSFETIIQERVVNVLTSDNNLSYDYILQIVNYNLSASKSVCIVTADDRDNKTLSEIFKKKYLSQFLLPLHAFNKNEFLEILNIPFRSHYNKTHRYELGNYLLSKYKINSLLNGQIGSFPFQLEKEQLNYLITLTSKGCNSSKDNLDISNYKIEYLTDDINFTKALESFDKINLIDIKKNIFYGLSCSSKRENYDFLMVTMLQILNLLTSFENKIKELDLKTINDEKISSFFSFEQLGKELNLLEKYNGFPKKYFSASILNEDEFPLQNLKIIFKSISSSKLLIKTLFKKSVFNLDLKKFVQDYDLNHNFPNNFKTLTKYLHKKARLTDYKLLIEIIRAYLVNSDKLNKILPSYIKQYGESINNLNGVIEIESNIKYIIEFNNMRNKNPSFTLDNPLITKCMKSRTYLNKCISSFNICNQIYLEILQKTNLYIGYCLEDDFDFTSSTFDEIHEHLKRKLHGKYDEFSQYSDFISLLNKSSYLLQQEISYRIENKISLEDFNLYYFNSFVKTYNKELKKTFANQERLFLNTKCDYISKMMVSVELFERYRHNKYLSIVEDEMKSDTFKNNLESIDYSKKNITLKEKENMINLLLTRYPISIISAKSINSIKDELFDEVIVYNSKSIDTLSLLSSLRIGKRCSFINKNTNDFRLSIYKEIKLSPSLLYLDHFDISALPNSFILALKKEANKRDYKLVTSNPIFPLILQNLDNSLKRIAIFPDIFISDTYKKIAYSSLPKFLLRVYGVPLFYINTIDFILDPVRTFFVIDDEIDQVNDNLKINLQNIKKLPVILTEEEKYQNTLKKILSSFEEYPSKDMIEQLLNEKKYDSLFYKLQPIKIKKLNEIDDVNFHKYIDYMLYESNLFIIKDGYYMDIALERIKFKRCNADTRLVEDISTVEFIQGIKEFASSFKTFDVDQLEEIFASLTGSSIKDSNFTLRFKEALRILKHRQIIMINNDKLSLKISEEE